MRIALALLLLALACSEPTGPEKKKDEKKEEEKVVISLEIIKPENGASFWQDEQIPCTVRVQPDSFANRVVWKINSQSNSQSVDCYQGKLNAFGLKVGEYIVSAEINAAGQFKADSAKVKIKNVKPPQVKILEPTDSVINEKIPITLKGEAIDERYGSLADSVFKWYENDTLIAKGNPVEVFFTAGEDNHRTLKLVVTNPSGISGGDSVLFRVNAAPLVSITFPRNHENLAYPLNTNIWVSATAEDPEKDSISSIAWIIDDTTLATSLNFDTIAVPAVGDPRYPINTLLIARVEDSYGAVGKDSLQIHISSKSRVLLSTNPFYGGKILESDADNSEATIQLLENSGLSFFFATRSPDGKYIAALTSGGELVISDYYSSSIIKPLNIPIAFPRFISNNLLVFLGPNPPEDRETLNGWGDELRIYTLSLEDMSLEKMPAPQPLCLSPPDYLTRNCWFGVFGKHAIPDPLSPDYVYTTLFRSDCNIDIVKWKLGTRDPAVIFSANLKICPDYFPEEVEITDISPDGKWLAVRFLNSEIISCSNGYCSVGQAPRVAIVATDGSGAIQYLTPKIELTGKFSKMPGRPTFIDNETVCFKDFGTIVDNGDLRCVDLQGNILWEVDFNFIAGEIDYPSSYRPKP